MGTPDHDHMDEAMTDAHYLNQQRAWGDYDRRLRTLTDKRKNASRVTRSNRWRVVREGDYDWCPGEYWWQAQELHDGEWYSDAMGMFSDWKKALDHAHRMAKIQWVIRLGERVGVLGGDAE